MKKHRILALSLAVVMTLLTACGGPAANTSPDPVDSQSVSSNGGGTPAADLVKLTLGTSSVGGSVYITGSGWANVLNNALAGQYEITAEQSGGSPANVSLIESGECDLGIISTDVLYGAYTGTASWADGTKFVKPLAVFTCDKPNLCPFTLAGSGIVTLHDLDGKRVGLGQKSSSIDGTFTAIFDEMGITPAQIYNDTWAATITALKDGLIDAIVVQSPDPWPSLTELEATNEVSMIQMTDDELAIIKEMFPYYEYSVIKAGAYKANADFDIKTLCQWSVVAASADLSEQVVYDLCEATFNNYDDLALVNSALQLAVPENASNVAVEWHPGAQRWYEEHDIILQEPIEGLHPAS